jgi:hypothetical protein
VSCFEEGEESLRRRRRLWKHRKKGRKKGRKKEEERKARVGEASSPDKQTESETHKKKTP